MAQIFAGPFCKKAGINQQMLLNPKSSLPHVSEVTKGLMLELLQTTKQHNIPWARLAEWAARLYSSEKPDIWGLRKSVVALNTRVSKLKKQRNYQPDLNALLAESFRLPMSKKPQSPQHNTDQEAGSTALARGSTSAARAYIPSKFTEQTISMVNDDLALELISWKRRHEQLEREAAKLRRRVEQYKPHNVRRREKRRDAKIASLQDKILHLQKQIKYRKRNTLKTQQSQVNYYKQKCAKLLKQKSEIENKCEHCEAREEENKALWQQNWDLEANAELREQNMQACAQKLTTFKDGKYSDEIRTCIMDLLAHNVSINQIDPVIRAVLKLSGVKCDRLPKHTVINDMLIESHAVAQCQLAEVLSKDGYNTLHTDGTTKYGHKYAGYQVTTEERTYTLGLRETADGTAQTELDTLNEILEDLSLAASASGKVSTEVGQKIIAQIKSTISDRASVEKCFNELLEQYRSDILPSVVEGWSDMSDGEQSAMSRMYNFFCGMHFITGMAEHTAEAIRLFESAESDTPSSGEAGAIRLIRTACKAFQRRADEKSGCPVHFTTYLRRHGIQKVPLANFRGNRFNIIFLNGARVFYLHKHILDFLSNCWGPQNKLLKAILEDASNELYIAGCRALGLIDKLVTGPLWRILESDIHILDVSSEYTQLLQFFTECSNDASQFLTGEKVPFPGTPINKDEIWAALVTPSSLDALVQQLLQAVFKSLELLAQRMLKDHLPGGKWEKVNDTTSRMETQSVSKTNTVSERDFAKFNRLLREKPHASTLALEAHILFSSNRTAEWLQEKNASEREILLQKARRLAPTHKKQFKMRLTEIHDQRRQALEKREEERRRREQKILLEKERLTNEIVVTGLWQTPDQVEGELSKLRTEKAKKDALKSQLKFRKTVLQQEYPDKGVYNFSKGRVQYSSKTLRENLLHLVHAAHNSPTPNTDITISLVGNSIEHRFVEDEKFVTYSGRIVSQVPGFPDWFNVVYDKEPGIVYTFKLMEDYRNGDLKIL